MSAYIQQPDTGNPVEVFVLFYRVALPAFSIAIHVNAKNWSYFSCNYFCHYRAGLRMELSMRMYANRVYSILYGLKVEYDLFPLYWSWDHFSVEKA